MKHRRFSIVVFCGLGLLAIGWLGWAERGTGALSQALKPILALGRSDAARSAADSGATTKPPDLASAAQNSAQPAANTPKSAGAGGAGQGPRGPVAVEVVAARAGVVQEEVQAVGTLRANESVMIRPEIAGRIARLGFSDGEVIKAGKVLVELDTSVPAAEFEQVRAERSLAFAKYERAVELAQKNFLSAQAREEAAANLQVVDARMSLAGARLEKSTIRAPFGGIVGLRNVAVGDFVKDGSDLVVLEDNSSMKVDLRLPERVVGRLRRGQSLEVGVDALPGKSFKATIDAIDATVDANGRSILVRARIPNSGTILRTGMFARARVLFDRRDDAVLLPEDVIVPEAADLFVWRVVEGKASKVKILAGVRRDAQVEVLEGVKSGESIVLAGQLKLNRDGQAVRVLEADRRVMPAAGPSPKRGE